MKAPRVVKKQLVPWKRAAGRCDPGGVARAVPSGHRGGCTALGLRQGEIFGLSVDEIDFLRRVVHVRQQVKLYLSVTPVFGPPKGGKLRDVPLPRQAAEALAAHLEQFPAQPVTLPWAARQEPDGKPRTYPLLFTAEKGTALSRSWFNTKVWVPARRAAGIPDGDDDAAGMHQLRHHFASVLLRGGVDAKRVQSYLGHHSAAFTLDVYGTRCPTTRSGRCVRSRRRSLRPRRCSRFGGGGAGVSPGPLAANAAAIPGPDGERYTTNLSLLVAFATWTTTEYREAWKRTDARLREERRRLREGERMLETWATEYKKRDEVIRSAVAAGISVRRVQQVTGIARTTVARILPLTARQRLTTRWRGHERRSDPIPHHLGWNRMPPSKRMTSAFM